MIVYGNTYWIGCGDAENDDSVAALIHSVVHQQADIAHGPNHNKQSNESVSSLRK
jgi:hypothetical protein